MKVRLHRGRICAPAALPIALLGACATAPAEAPSPAPPPQPAESDWRAPDPENTLVVDTTKGRFVVEMTPVAAPEHVKQIKALTRQGLYDGRAFFRVIDWFMAQTGDPTDTGEGESKLPDLKAEFVWRRAKSDEFASVARPSGAQLGFIGTLPVVSQSDDFFARTGDGKVAAWGTYCPGVAGMARDEDPDSANSQFFFMRQAYPSLDKRYTVWGRVITGLEAVRAIKTGEPVTDPDKMTRVRVLADMAADEAPKVRYLDPKSAAFAAQVERVRRERGADFSLCDLDIPVRLD